MALVVVARFLVRFVPFDSWRSTVGQIVPAGLALACGATSASDEAFRRAHAAARSIDRACRRLPGTSRCLPRAVALQWILRFHSMPALTVIAFNIKDRVGEHAYHAWVECGGEMLIGHCDREAYKAIMVLAADPAAIAPNGTA